MIVYANTNLFADGSDWDETYDTSLETAILYLSDNINYSARIFLFLEIFETRFKFH